MSNPESEQEFLASYDIHDYDVPLVCVDMVIFAVIDSQLNVLIAKRSQFPSKGKWALPGGFIDLNNDSSIEATAARKLTEKTGVSTSHLEQVKTVGNKTRDPRGWSLTVVYMALISTQHVTLNPDQSYQELAWKPVNETGIKYRLAFDHKSLIDMCYQRLQNKVEYTSLPVNLLEKSFSLSELQSIFEIILDKRIEKKSFRRRILDANILEETGEMKTGSYRPAKLYKVKKKGKSHFFQRSIEGPR